MDLFWLDPGQICNFARHAPDLWAWRTAALDFSFRPGQPLPIQQGSTVGLPDLDRESAQRRLGQIDAYLSGEPPRTAVTADLLREAAGLRYRLGDLLVVSHRSAGSTPVA